MNVYPHIKKWSVGWMVLLFLNAGLLWASVPTDVARGDSRGTALPSHKILLPDHESSHALLNGPKDDVTSQWSQPKLKFSLPPPRSYQLAFFRIHRFFIHNLSTHTACLGRSSSFRGPPVS